MRSTLSRRLIQLAGVVFALVLLPQLPAAAQQRIERYQPPSRPTLSPYLDLFRQDSGLVDPYNAFVVPRRRMEAQARQFQSEIGAQQRTINQLQGELQGALQMRPTGARPTGTGGTFMNFSHFYPAAAAARAPRR